MRNAIIHSVNESFYERGWAALNVEVPGGVQTEKKTAFFLLYTLAHNRAKSRVKAQTHFDHSFTLN